MCLGVSAAVGQTLKEEVKADALPLLITTNQFGLGAEAQALVPWIRAHPGPLTLRPESLLLEDLRAATIRISPAMARTLQRLNQWHGLAATKDNPITHAQLRAGALSPASIDRIRAIFEAMIDRGVRIGPKWLTPETGGEATLDTELRLVEARDPRWSTIQDLVKFADDPKAIAALCEGRAAEVAMVDTHGLLKVAVARLRLGAPGSSAEVSRALLTVAQNAAPTYSLGPEEQFALVTGASWQGRYVGGWHTHAPHDVNGAWAGGDVPSFEDMRNAVQYGQYLTLSFQPDGFDLYDAEALGDAKRVDLTLVKVIRYRSPAWREHFRKRRACENHPRCETAPDSLPLS
jgi:hypothetical protein